MLCGQIQSFYSCLGKVLLVQMRRTSQGCFGCSGLPGVWGGLVGDYRMSRLVEVSLADLFLFVPSCDPPSPTQRLDCTTLQS